MSANIANWLAGQLGPEVVTKDLPHHSDLRTQVRHRISGCSVFLVVMGKQWLYSVDSDGHWQRDDPNDPVRIEIETALELDVPIIPLLLRGAVMPAPERLPASLQSLCSLKGYPIRGGGDFEADMTNVLRVLAEWLTPGTAPVFSLPRLEWCTIPAGQVVIDGTPYAVDAFKMSKYLVTLEQYSIFLDHPTSIGLRWWNYSERARQWHRTRPLPIIRDWGLPPTRPIYGISWYDTVAFCRWLSDKLKLEITLPTTQQWKQAASGADQRRYPWGNAYEPAKGSSLFTLVDSTEPNPFGVCGLGGQIHQWTLNPPLRPFDRLRSGAPDEVTYWDAYREVYGGYYHELDLGFDIVECSTTSIPLHMACSNLGIRLVQN